MQEQLQSIADAINHTFGYGTLDDLENIAGDHLSGYLLFHEGYFEADIRQDGQGALEEFHQLVLDICVPSLISDKPEDKLKHLRALKVEYRRVYNRLTKIGVVSKGRVVMGLNLTTRNLDAIKLTLTLLPPAVSICKL